MRYPTFVAEMARPENRHKLWLGTWSGYAMTAALGVIAAVATYAGVLHHPAELGVMLGAKMVTNTLPLIALRRGGRGALELMGLNMITDAVVITGAIYYTGGPASPLIAVYVIAVTVTALLSNAGVTVVTAALNLAAYATMCVLVAAGALAVPRPLGAGTFGAWEAIVHVAFAVLAVGVPTGLALRILRALRDKEAVLAARTAELIEAGRQRSTFLASVTHELRTPIHGIQGLADLITVGVYGPATDKQKEAATSIKRSAQGLLHLVDDLLAMVRADVGRLDVKPGPVDLRAVVEQVVASVQWMLGTKKLTLATEVEPARPDAVFSDRRLIGHILVNLVANAAKFTPASGRVIVRARVEEPSLVLEVSDTGIGIPDDKREEIFEAFRQLDATDERTYGGVGLGLALVKRLTDLLGGRVEVESEVGKGSTFRVHLPARIEAPPREYGDEEPTSMRAKSSTIRGVPGGPL